MEPRVLLATILVNSTADTDVRDTELTLREAILVANGSLAAGTLSPQEQAQVTGAVQSGMPADTINFDLPGSGAQSIALMSALPDVTDPVVIDGTSQPGYAGTPLVRLVGGGTGANADGLRIMAGDSTVQGLAIVGFDGAGIVLQGDGNTVRANYVGIDTDGTTVLGNHQGGVVVTSANNTIGGTTAADRNVITGNGSIFQSVSVLATGAAPVKVGVADIDGDGKGDVVTLDGVGNINARLGNGDGTFQAPTLVAAMPGATSLLVAGSDFSTDVNGDFTPDLVVANGTTGDVNVLFGNGDGTFGAPQLVATVPSPKGLAVIQSASAVAANRSYGDIVVAGGGATGNVQVIPNSGVGAFETFGAPVVLAAGSNPVAVAVATFGSDPITFDPNLAIVVANRDSNNVSVLARNPDGTYQPAVNVAVGTNPVAITAADVTGDNLDDIVTANSGSNDVTVLIRGAGGGFTPRTLAVGNAPSGVVVADLDGDNKPDIATSDASDGTVSVILRKPSGQLRPAVSFLVGPAPGSLAVGRVTSGTPSLFISANIFGSTLDLLLPNTGNSDGIALVGAGASGNVIAGNFIGTDATGASAPGNVRNGVLIDGASNNTIGGTAPGAGNLISGNASYGVDIEGTSATGNLVQGNRIGTDAAGTAALGNFLAGVFIHTAGGNTIGGVTPGAGNLISGNLQYGVRIQGEYNQNFDDIIDAPNNIIQGNTIGLNASGTAKLANAKWGISIDKATGTFIGSPMAGGRNVVSGNGDHGIDVRGATVFDINNMPVIKGATGTVIQGNYVGTNAAGTAALGNGGEGIYLDTAPGVTIGGSADGAGNLVSGNGDDGIALRTSDDAVIQGNKIGTDAAGTAAFGNGTDASKVSAGIFLADSANAQVGGAAAGAGNLISGNIGRGILVSRPKTQGAHVEGNFIGTDVTGTLPLANSLDGVTIHNSASNNTIGGTSAGTGNLIAFNGGAGIRIELGDMPEPAGQLPTGNSLFENILFQNAGGAIVSTANATPTPTLTSVTSTGGVTHIVGVVTGPANAVVRVEFFDPPAGAPTFLGSTDVALDGSGQGAIDVNFPSAVPGGNPVIATATVTSTPALNTSPFSAPVQVNTAPFDLSIAQTVAPNPGVVGQDLTYTITVRNNFTDPAHGVMVAEMLLGGLTFVSATPSPTMNTGGALTFDLGTLAGEETKTITVVARPTATGTATSAISVMGDEADPDTGNNASTLNTTVNAAPVADLAVTQTAAPTPGTTGQDLTYTILVTNNGPDDATNVVLTDALPQGVVFVSATPGVTTNLNGVLTFNLGGLAAGATRTVTVLVRPASAGTLTNALSVLATEMDPVATNNTNSLDTIVNPGSSASADLSVVLAAAPSSVIVGQDLNYAVFVANAGPDPATSTVLTITLPTSVTFVTASMTPASISGRVLTFNLGTVNQTPTQVTSPAVTITVRPTAAGSITSTAAITSADNDPNAVNNSATATTTVNPNPSANSADLSILQTATPSQGSVGQNLTYTITVTNLGPATATGVILMDALPAGAVFVSASETPVGTPGSLVEFNLGDLASGATRTITVVARPTQAGTATNIVAVASPTADDVQANNTARLDTPVTSATTQAADLLLTLTTSPSPAVVGQNLVYTFTVTNAGPGVATGVVFTQSPPAGALVNGVSSSQGSVKVPMRAFLGFPANPFVIADLGDLAPGASATITVVVQSTTAGVLGGEAHVTTTATDPNPNNNVVSPAVVVNPAVTTAPTVTNLERFGVHFEPTRLVIRFNQALNPTSAQDLNNYLLVDPGRDGRFFTRDDRVLPLGSATYDPTAQAVTLAPRHLLKLRARYGLLINGNPGGLTGQNGQLIDGDGDGMAGGDFVTTFGQEIWRGGQTPIPARARPAPRSRAALPRGPRPTKAHPILTLRSPHPHAGRRG